ncbi:glycosyl transferase [Betaproteobacteria bacterium]|nr:glycosyl transferase [Betaproteobacteria bacterium]
MSNVNTGKTVSVIIPAYNAALYVLEAIDSVLAQNYQPIEILLIDDGSTDGTAELVENKRPQARVIRQANAGVAEARNTGLRHAVGDFICFLDADDGWYPGKIAAQLDHLDRHQDVGAVFHAWRIWQADKDGKYSPLPWQPPSDSTCIDPEQSGWIYPQVLMGYIIHTSTIMIRREWVKKVGFFRIDLVVGEDYDYWLRLSRVTKIDKLAAMYSFYRRGSEESLTRAVRPVDYGYELVRDAVAQWGLSAADGATLSRQQINRRLGALAFDFAYVHFHRGSALLARQASWRAFRHDPRRWKALAYILVSLFRKG